MDTYWTWFFVKKIWWTVEVTIKAHFIDYPLLRYHHPWYLYYLWLELYLHHNREDALGIMCPPSNFIVNSFSGLIVAMAATEKGDGN